MKPPGQIIIEAVVRANALTGARANPDSSVTFIWSAAAADQIEAALAEAGYQLTQAEKPKIILICCVCGRKLAVDREPEDPDGAVELRGTACDKCDHGGFDQPTYYDAIGEEVEP